MVLGLMHPRSTDTMVDPPATPDNQAWLAFAPQYALDESRNQDINGCQPENTSSLWVAEHPKRFGADRGQARRVRDNALHHSSARSAERAALGPLQKNELFRKIGPPRQREVPRTAQPRWVCHPEQSVSPAAHRLARCVSIASGARQIASLRPKPFQTRYAFFSAEPSRYVIINACHRSSGFLACGLLALPTLSL